MATKEKFTIICTVNENNESFNFQVKEWQSESKCQKLVNRYAKGNVFIDYVCCVAGDQVSCTIHAKY